jgi:hypothetical protein
MASHVLLDVSIRAMYMDGVFLFVCGCVEKDVIYIREGDKKEERRARRVFH